LATADRRVKIQVSGFVGKAPACLPRCTDIPPRVFSATTQRTETPPEPLLHSTPHAICSKALVMHWLTFESSRQVTAQRCLIRGLMCLTGFWMLATCSADDQQSPTFEQDVRPILKKHCFQCHGEEETPEAGLDLRLVRLMQKGGESGTAVHAGSPDDSLLFQRIRDGEMPPDEPKQLSEAEVKSIRDWIAAGAQVTTPEPESAPSGLIISNTERSHWAFQPIHRPTVPNVNHADLVKNPIDAFLLHKLESSDFSFAPRAASHTLLRRLCFDVWGLPPSIEMLQRDVGSPEAFAVVVEDLLNDPRYGERWARHWLDVAGYADSEGYTDVDSERPHAWRYRDYVIQAFNEDKPFDRFIQEQLAGDELMTSPLSSLSKADAQLLTATGFLRMAPDGTGSAVPDKMLARNDTVADTVRIVSTSLLGLTVGCAQCHDHRYDPISQQDYYSFRAIFDPALDWQQWRNPQQRLVSLYTDADRKLAAEIEDKAKLIDADRSTKQAAFIEATFEKELAKLPAEIRGAAREAREAKADKRTDAQKALMKSHPSLNVTAGSLYLYDKKAADELKVLADKAAGVRKEKPVQNFVRALTEVPGRVPESHLFFRGDHEQLKQSVPPAGLTVVSLNVKLPAIDSESEELPTSGRRLALAQRLTSPEHPLTSRVIVNRVWMHHFGRGLVATPGDFGILGERPTHPELLDWLAAEFVSSGWSLKHIHTLILNSTAWQQQLRNDPDQDMRDPDNLLYGGARLGRLDAEVLRDSILFVSGKLNEKRFGPPVPVMADTVGRFVIGKENLNAGRPGDVIDMKGEQYRRSIYVQVRRSRPLAMLETFDLPAMAPNCEMRKPSTSSIQSLMLMNSDQMVTIAKDFATRLTDEAGDDIESQVRLAWQLVFARLPEESEVADAVHFLDTLSPDNPASDTTAEEAGAKPDTDIEAFAVLCQMLLSSNGFLYVD
jgi:mono/diheme cytochrome c family protein